MSQIHHPFQAPPGTVINHIYADSRQYIGSPSFAILPDGSYVASHDLFGPGSTEHQAGTTLIFRSEDQGAHWKQVARIESAFWCNLFVHQGALYLFGLTRHHGLLVIRRSEDGGKTWTEPREATSGLLTPEGEYHTAPVPVLVHNGKIWRAVESAGDGTVWGHRYNPIVLSAAVDADLLRRDSWTFSSPLRRSLGWLEGKFGGWLEGNIVPLPDGRLANVLRVDYPAGGKAALVILGDDSHTLEFSPETGFLDLPGGATKFHIRQDKKDGGYWMFANAVPPRHAKEKSKHSLIRNTLALFHSIDLRSWKLRHVPLYHPDVEYHAFQYPDWLFDGDDLALISRTAWDDDRGGAHRGHDANFLTWHRIRNFRDLTPENSPVNPFTAP